MSGKSLIIGYGNPLRGDDGIGQAAAQAFADEAAGDGIDVVRCHQLMPELAEQLAAVDLAVFVDAGATGAPGGVVTTRLQAAQGRLQASPTMSTRGSCWPCQSCSTAERRRPS